MLQKGGIVLKKRFWGLMLTLAAVCALVPTPVLAAEHEPQAMQLGSAVLRSVNLNAAALRPADGAWDLGGNIVYFGQYGGEALAYRPLCSPETQSPAEEGLLLDCASIIRRKAFDENFRRNEGQEKLPSEWKGSDLEAWLNGSNFYESLNVFTHMERSAIPETTLADARTLYSTSHWTDMYRDFGSTDRVFLLSAAEVSGLYAQDAARAKDGATTDWWVRSAFDTGGNGAGSVHFDGHVCNNSVSNFVVGISPALNVRLSDIQLVTPADGDKMHPVEKVPPQGNNTEWKLTLLDPTKTITLTEEIYRYDENGAARVIVPCTWEGNEIFQISLVLTDDAGNALYYGATEKANGSVSFFLPQDLCSKICGRDYFAYLLAEDVNASYRTDYASEFCEIEIPKL